MVIKLANYFILNGVIWVLDTTLIHNLLKAILFEKGQRCTTPVLKKVLLCAHKKLVDEGTERIFKRVVKHDGSIIKKRLGGHFVSYVIILQKIS